ncbi:MAG: S-layer homology domain-containing protein [Oscillospiraceae bacterium]|jgi:hypothetical protein|nr:S-layer homology domain-containing protein [Oscillospiraceae bacterium]
MKKILSFSLAVCVLLSVFPFHTTLAAEDNWRSGGILAPAREQLVPAGPVWVRWSAVPNAARYIVYLDDLPGETVPAANSETFEAELYTVEVAAHTVWIEAQLTNGESILTEPRTFYVSKKGIGFFSELSNMEEMNLSWYYTWSANPSNQKAVSGLDFTPMFWNGSANQSRIGDYKTILGCNEPDHPDQANVSAANVAKNWWPSFVSSGKRLGSPAAAWEYENKPGQWLYDFMELIKQPDGSYPVDFIAIHDYAGWPGNTDEGADQIAGFRSKIEDLWNRYRKPIWITEFAVANWPSNQDDIQSWGYTKQHVYDYMDKLLTFINDCPYIERYAWFSFGDPDGNRYGESAGSHAALTVRSTGELTRLGELYRDKGNPDKTTASALLPNKTPNVSSADVWAREAILSAIEKGFVPADLRTDYTGVITRLDFCRLAVRYMEYSTGKTVDEILSEKGLRRDGTVFTDVTNSDVLAAYALGITSGAGGGKFNPYGQFTRQSAAGMIMNLHRAMGIDVSDPPPSGFADADKISVWSKAGVDYCVSAGIMAGGSGNVFNPDGAYTLQASLVTFDNMG